MELRHLRTLDAIARHGSFTRAAEELHLAQSAVSQQVRRLEAELGVDLLRRTSRRVDVTEAGQVVLDYARRVLSEVDGLQAELEDLTGVLRGKVQIGAMWPTGTYDLPGVLGAFHGRHPAWSSTCSRTPPTTSSTSCAATSSTARSPRSSPTGSATSSPPPSSSRRSSSSWSRPTTASPARST
jgi:DNA-binding transcriptional LysR family regulator